jgi:hypothetical protein
MGSVNEEQVISSLERLLMYSSKGRLPTASRFQTLKAMVALGQRWQSPREVMRQLRNLKINTNYVFEIQGHFPEIMETNWDKSLVRIRPEAFQTVAKLIDDYILRIRSSKPHPESEDVE